MRRLELAENMLTLQGEDHRVTPASWAHACPSPTVTSGTVSGKGETRGGPGSSFGSDSPLFRAEVGVGKSLFGWEAKYTLL